MSAFEPCNRDWIAHTLQVYGNAPFLRDLGIRIVDLAPGRIVTELDLAERHLQQDGYVHAGVQATMADHTAGTAASTLMAADRIVLTIEMKLSLMAPARGERLICRGEVMKPGRQVTFTEAKVYAIESGKERLVSHLTASMAIVGR